MFKQLIVFVSILFVNSTILSKEKTNNKLYSNEEHCMLSTKEAEDSPWTVTIKLENTNSSGTGNYFSGVILDAFTVVTCGKAFHALTDKLQFLAVGNYTIGVGDAIKTESGFNFSQTAEVSFIQPHPNYNGKWNAAYWMYSENFYVIIHLKTPLNFTTQIKPVCLPNVNNVTSMIDLQNLVLENTIVLIGGWKKSQIDMEKTSINIKLSSVSECTIEWARRGFTSEQIVLPYRNRLCGYTTERNSNNPTAQCIDKNSGAFINDGGRYIFIGFLNTYYSVLDLCDKNTFMFIYETSLETLQWMKNTMRCGSLQYTCHNGECVSLDTVCNQIKDGCKDESDENPKYCRALNPCTKDEFECGVYGKCIPKIQMEKEALDCDGINDCENGEDEDPILCKKDMIENNLTELPIVGITLAGSLFIVLSFSALGIISYRIRKRKVKALNVQTRNLTNEEVMDFENGAIDDEYDNIGFPEVKAAYIKPYDITAFEIPFKNIKKGMKIGSGFFGSVYMGQILDHPEGKECAIKVLRTTAGVDQTKAFLKELKIMIYVGRNENIVKFIGAYTREIRKRVLYIVLEYCEFGSMETFLRKNCQFYTNNVQHVENNCHNFVSDNSSHPQHYVSVDTINQFNELDLIRWSIEIASGMSFLANKNVIHGDLAARNILLDNQKNIKIADFGLSHHLYTSSSYFTSTNCQLPWKWMAPETIQYRNLSIKSDVWSYGITLWEIFNLGIVPYSELEWNQIFLNNLITKGCSLEKPIHANYQIFEIMKECWKINPEKRPTFELIKCHLTNTLSSNV